MKKNGFRSFSFWIIFFLLTSPVYSAVSHEKMMDLVQRQESESLLYAQQNGAVLTPVNNERSFILWWQSKDFDPSRDTVFFSLHDRGGWVTKDFQAWHPRLTKRNYAYIGLQWWYGGGKGLRGYIQPAEIYRLIQDALEKQEIPRGHVIFHGVGFGSSNSYAVTYFDQLQETPYFAMTIADGGELQTDFPPNHAFLDLRPDLLVFERAHWILYCSEKDPENQNLCEKMEFTKSKLILRGAHIERLIRDSSGNPEGMMSSEILEPVFDSANKMIAKNNSNPPKPS